MWVAALAHGIVLRSQGLGFRVLGFRVQLGFYRGYGVETSAIGFRVL